MWFTDCLARLRLRTIKNKQLQTSPTVLTSFHLLDNLPVEIVELIWKYTFCTGPPTLHGYIESRYANAPQPLAETLPLWCPPFARAVQGMDGQLIGIVLAPGATGLEITSRLPKDGWRRRRVFIWPSAHVRALLHTSSKSREVVVKTLERWLDGVLAEMCKSVGEDGKPWIVQKGRDQGLLYAGTLLDIVHVDNRDGNFRLSQSGGTRASKTALSGPEFATRT